MNDDDEATTTSLVSSSAITKQRPQSYYDISFRYRDAENDECCIFTERDFSAAIAQHFPQQQQHNASSPEILILAKVSRLAAPTEPHPILVKVKEPLVDDQDDTTTTMMQQQEHQSPSIQQSFPGKWVKHKTLTYGCLENYIHLRREPQRSIYGGRMDQQYRSTGFFRVERLAGGWTFLDPQGYPFICAGINSVAPHNTESDFQPFFHQKFGGDTAQWAKTTHAYLFQEAQVNTYGAWTDVATLQASGIRAPYCLLLNLMLEFAGSRKRLSREGVIPVFDPEFEVYCDTKAKEKLMATREDPYLLGIFADNEMPLKAANILQNFLALAENDHGRQTAISWMDERGISPDTISDADNTAFCTLVISRYYRIISSAIKRYDPNHLFIGSRFHGGVLDQDVTFRACAPWVDVITVNYYHRWTINQEEITKWAELSGRPIMATEWYCKSDDTHLDNRGGAGYVVPHQSDRGAFFEHFAMGILRNPNTVGYHWFRYIDSSSANVGLYDIHYEPWESLGDSMKRIHSRLYSLSDYLRTSSSPAYLDKDETVPG